MQNLIYIAATFLLALSISLFAVPIIVRVTHALKLLDKPNLRSATKIPVTTLGGIAIFLSFLFSSTFGLSRNALPEFIYIVAAVILMFFVGLKDDILTVSATKKFIAQLVTASIIIFLAKIRFTNLHGLFGIGEIGIIPGVILSFIAVIGIINAFNLMDGIDGLAGGFSMLAAGIFGSWFFISGHYDYAIISVSLVGAIAGFFYFNVYGKVNKIFMGDTGSLLIGTIMSAIVIRFNEFNIDQTLPFAVNSAPAVSFGILIYPLVDAMRVMTIRILQLKSPFTADKNHLHHRLLTLGYSHEKATCTIIVANILLLIPVFALRHLGIVSLMGFNVLVSGILFMIPAYFIHKRQLINKNDPNQQLLFPGSSFRYLKRIRLTTKVIRRRYASRAVNLRTFLQKFSTVDKNN